MTTSSAEGFTFPMASFFTDFVLAESSGSFSGSLQAVWHFFRAGGWFMAPILICSLGAAGLVIFKFLELQRKLVIPPQLERSLENVDALAAAGRLGDLERQLRGDESVLGRICRTALFGRHPSREEATAVTESLAREEVSRLERGIPALEVIFTVAPLLGLIGTVGGLVGIFGTFGSRAQTTEQSALIAQGISEALNTTIMGLAVAVPTYFFQSFFSRRVESLALRMGTLTTCLINAACRNRNSGTDLDDSEEDISDEAGQMTAAAAAK